MNYLPLVLLAVGGGLLWWLAHRDGGAMSTAEFDAMADSLGIPPRLARAILQVESGGQGFGKDGRLLIRFEPGVFVSRAGVSVAATHAGQAGEWQAFTQATAANKNAALNSISMGLPQIMGFNYQLVGYDSVEAMYADFSSGLAAQQKAFFRFMTRAAGGALLAAAKRNDLQGVARYYNGDQTGVYAARLASAGA